MSRRLDIYIRVSRIGNTSATYECAAYRVDYDMLLATAHQTLVLVDLDARQARRISDWFRERVRGFEGDSCEM